MSAATYGAAELRALLEKRASVQEIDATGWKIASGDACLTARAAHGWIHLDAECGADGVNGHAWDLLESNAGLPAGVKFVVPEKDDTVRVRAELPLDREISLDARLPAAVEGVLRAMRWPSSRDDDRRSCLLPSPVDLGDVSARARESGWSDLARSTGPFHVDLDVRRGGALAGVTRHDDGLIEVSVDLDVDAGETTEICSQAVALLLLRVAAGVRMVRAATVANRPRFEVVCEAEPAVAEIGHAFSALSVACAHAAREARALHGDEAVARLYLDTTHH